MRLAFFTVGLLVALLAANGAGADPAADKPAPKPERPANRLAKETSPYLLLHAHNPVDWYPWGEEALAKAKREKKLIFLSIGYSSCYWCHVMERESFMNDAIAAKLNKHFVCIKVDREERPDIDEIYMQSLHAYLQLVGSKQGGGWPLSMFLTSDAKPLMGGTYFPPEDKQGRLGFSTVLDRVLEAWNAEPEKWQKTGDALAEFVAESLRQRPMLQVVPLDAKVLDGVLRALATQFDDLHGGFNFDPANPRLAKFPEPPNLEFLLAFQRRTPSKPAQAMLAVTLDKILHGGIRDHIGGGFHRYSTDRFWQVPHFEKMLYDNAQLITVYSLAHEATPNPEYRRAVDEAIAFLMREMRDPGGAFYSALDAETNAEEGTYYVWDRTELKQLLTPEEYALAAEVYGFAGEANFEERWIPLLPNSVSAVAKKLKLSDDQLLEKLQPIRQKLLAARNKRPRPLTDTKILTSWNGLAIRGLAEAGRVFDNQAYTTAAVQAAEFILSKLRDDQGQLLRTYASGQAKIPAYLDDYAFLAEGLLALHRTTGDKRWLEEADALTAAQLPLFWDERAGGFYYTSKRHEQLIARSKLATDTVMPAGNSVSASNLVALAAALDRPEYLDRAKKCFEAMSPILNEQPGAVPRLATALGDWLQTQPKKSEPAKPAAAK